MSISLAKRIAGFAVILTSLFAASPSAGAQSRDAIWKAAPSVITCQPGYVYRCGPHGCYCVKA